MIHSYNSLAYANLHEFEVVREKSTKYNNKLEELGKIIKKHNLENVVGICLLHKHFNIYDEERLVRTFVDNKFKLKPEVVNESQLIPYMFAFTKISKNESLNMYPVEYLKINTDTESYRENLKQLMDNESFLNEFKNSLLENNLSQVFGLSFLPYKLFDLKEGEMLLETEDSDLRTENSVSDIRNLKIERVPNVERGEGITTKTLWDFSARTGEMNCHHHCDHPM
ncbi:MULTISPECIES: hypothetical protein [Bacillus]|uniref:hypothetical protein n=1 Tax=Bacillus TaxID=1386 RepID=UPI000DC1E078|nr:MULTISPECIES: hypothetical protein [Bacillus]AWX21600.1 hypothetical protein CXF51_07285 [Bacillus subtilis subsp. subtilis]MDI6565615.1 hypothetical protein [Bacillus subtilis]MEC1875247.1 hypothetical protein [Bacillus subtilis]MEC1936004.1 hypothetical protein [Bacillus subtilis]UYP04573.1 hypothetical protein OEG95_06170 [Bacillus subtilis]